MKRSAPLFFLFALTVGCASTTAPSDGPRRWIGGEIQAYPAGVITAFHGQTAVSDTEVITARIGYNATDRQDFGEHDDEEGGGAGGGAGYRRYHGPDYTGWLWGGRLDFWDLEIDWEDDRSGGGTREGTTDVIVLQPTLEAGYAWTLGHGWKVDVTAALGAEINVDTEGEDVGEGAIFLVGATFVHSF